MSLERKLLTEPVRKPDGYLLTIEQAGPDLIILNEDGVECCYSVDDVFRLGLGDFEVGISRLGQEAFLGNSIIGGRRYFAEELGDF